MTELIFKMTYQNYAGRLGVYISSKNPEPYTQFLWFSSTDYTLESAKSKVEFTSQLFKLAEKMNKLLRDKHLSTFVLSYSYITPANNIFTPFVCLQKQYCMGICHSTLQLMLVSYGELFCECKQIKRNNSLQSHYDHLVQQRTEDANFSPLSLSQVTQPV